MSLFLELNGSSAVRWYPSPVNSALRASTTKLPSVGAPTTDQPSSVFWTTASVQRERAITSSCRSRRSQKEAVSPDCSETAWPSGLYPTPVIEYRSTDVTSERTVISLYVRVPVLSEQIVVTSPSVSTAVSSRVIALRWTICRTPRASVIVTIAGSPSGTAATAKVIAESSSCSGPSPCSSKPTTVITPAIRAT